MDLLGSLSARSSQSKQEVETHQCSRKGCQNRATHQILWNNPKIHTPDRRKAWLACDEHREYLENFLKSRDFWKTTEKFSG